MKKSVAVITLIFLLGCSDPRSTVISTAEADKPKMEAAMKKLTDEERGLVAGYIMRTSISAAFSGKTTKLDGVTIGDAISMQKEWGAEQKKKDEEAAALKAKLKVEREAAEKQMNDAVTVTLISKKIRPEYGYSGIKTNEWLDTTVAYQNNTQKAIAGVKGRLTIYDIFDKEITALLISNDDDIEPGKSISWKGARSIEYGMNSSGDRKFGELPDGKYKVKWEPIAIVFKDGTKMVAAE